MKLGFRLFAATAGAAGLWLVSASTILACIPIATLNLSQAEATPGSKITATMQQASTRAGDITLHWNAVDGPVLATATPGVGGMTATFNVPSDAKGGYFLVVATQDSKPDVGTFGLPARAVLHVVGSGGSPVNSTVPTSTVPARASGLAVDPGPDLGVLALVALAAAAVGLIVVGTAALVVSRNPRADTVRGN
ncbi:MAG: hypothetical protein NVS9B11_13070 [Candidatus Dormibacteraceae bacterium]